MQECFAVTWTQTNERAVIVVGNESDSEFACEYFPAFPHLCAVKAGEAKGPPAASCDEVSQLLSSSCGRCGLARSILRLIYSGSINVR